MLGKLTVNGDTAGHVSAQVPTAKTISNAGSIVGNLFEVGAGLYLHCSDWGG